MCVCASSMDGRGPLVITLARTNGGMISLSLRGVSGFVDREGRESVSLWP